MKASKLAKLLKAEGLDVVGEWEEGEVMNASVSLGPNLLVEILDKADLLQAVKGPLVLHTFNPSGEHYYNFGEVKKLAAAAKRIIEEVGA